MGASGVNLFDDDSAADVREIFLEQLKRGASGKEATSVVISSCLDADCSEDEGVVWLALASVQWEHGILEKRVLKKALEVIDSGTDLERWAFDPKLQRKRAKVLATLRDKLMSPQTSPKVVKVRKRQPLKCDWKTGDMFTYQLLSGQFVIMRVIAIYGDDYEQRPLCELLDWVGSELPAESAIRNTPIRRSKRYRSESSFYFPLMKKHLAQTRLLQFRTEPTIKDNRDCQLRMDFNRLAEELKEHFGMSVDAFVPQET